MLKTYHFYSSSDPALRESREVLDKLELYAEHVVLVLSEVEGLEIKVFSRLN